MRRFFTAFSLFLVCFLASSHALSCSRVLYTTKTHGVLVGSNMDWFEDMKTNLWVYPQGIARDGQVTGAQVKWVSKYGSIVATAYDSIPAGGMNEKGLAAHFLALRDSDYGDRDETKPGLSILLWAQYYLDNFQTVAEAVKFTESNPFQLIPHFEPRLNRRIDLHLALEDASGDSAIIEYVNGLPRVYHDPDYKVLTNQPTFDLQLSNLKLYAGFGGDKPLPGTTDSKDRFVRASYYVNHMPEPETTQDGVFQVLSIMQNAGQPYGSAAPERPVLSESIWRTVSDLTHHTYYFNSTKRFNIFWVNLNAFNLHAGSSVMKLDVVSNPHLVGEVSKKFKAMV